MDVLDALEIFGTGDGSWGDGVPDPACVAGELPGTKEMDAFRLLSHRDLMLLMGFSASDVLVGLFAPSFIDSESSEKRLDGGLDAASKPVKLSSRPSEAGEGCRSDDSSDAKNSVLCCGSSTSMDTEG